MISGLRATLGSGSVQLAMLVAIILFLKVPSEPDVTVEGDNVSHLTFSYSYWLMLITHLISLGALLFSRMIDKQQQSWTVISEIVASLLQVGNFINTCD